MPAASFPATTQSAMQARRVRSLPLASWPPADRTAWEAACRPGKRLDRGGAAAHLAPVTQADLARRYGYFLDHLDRCGGLKRDGVAGALVTADTMAGFIAELQERASSVTVAMTVYKIRRLTQLIAPALDLAWLCDLENDLTLVARPQDKFDRIVATERLVEAGLTLVAEAEAAKDARPLHRALLARNGLMVALLAHCPIRLRNLVALEIGSTFMRIEDMWWILLADTKSGRPDERPVSSLLDDAIASYLGVHRPVLLRRPHDPRPTDGDIRGDPGAQGGTWCEDAGPLWISCRGGRMSRVGVQHALAETTRKTLGVPVSAHLFRGADATTAALHGSGNPHLASALLQHRDRSIVQEHYNRASSLSVASDFAALIRGLGDQNDVADTDDP